MTATPDHLLTSLTAVARLAQRVVDQYDVAQSEPDDECESHQLFLAVRDLRKALDQLQTGR
jgi:hypothetical protein